MSAQIISFPIEADQLTICGVHVKRPYTKSDYLKIVKRFLTEEDYKDICVGILDHKHFETLGKSLQKIVWAYMSYES